MGQQRIGILGGGQLGAMLIRSAIDFGLDISVMDKDPQAACANYSGSFRQGDIQDFQAVMDFGKDLDIITIEIEAVNTDALFALQKQGVKVYPSPEIISIVQDKYRQKEFMQQHGLPVAPAVLVTNKEDLKKQVTSFPVCLKLCREGYDGRGVMMLKAEADLEKAFDAPSIVEAYVAIKHELSVIVARNVSGNVKTFDPVAMLFDKERHVLDYQLCPSPVSPAIANEATSLAVKIAGALQLVGILAVEMFVTEDDKVIVNELAPRPHNSGHHSIEACVTSQYEQHLRAILDLPLGATTVTSPSVMVNLLGNAVLENGVHGLVPLLGMEGVHLHWYGKGYRPGRKLGHITVRGKDIAEAFSKATTVRKFLNSNNG